MAFRNISVRITADASAYVKALKEAAKQTQIFANSARSADAAAKGSSGGGKNAEKQSKASKDAAASMGSQTKATNEATMAMSVYKRAMGSSAAETAHTSAAGHRASLVFRSISEQTGFAAKALAGLKAAGIAAVSAFAGFIAINTAINIFKEGIALVVQGFFDFQNNITESLAIVEGATASVRKEFEETAKSISLKTIFSPAEVAKGIYYLASAGYEGEQALLNLETAAKFAQAGLMELDKATEVLTDVNAALGGFSPIDPKKTKENFDIVADGITRVAVDSNATIEQVGQSFTNKLAPYLRTLGRSTAEGIREGGAMIAALANQGIKGPQGGTYSQMALRDLSTKALKNAGAFKRLNIEVYDAKGNFRNFPLIIKDLENALGGMSDAQQRAAISSLGLQDRSIQAILAFKGTGDYMLQEQRRLSRSSGTVDKISKNQFDSFMKQMDRAKNAITTFGIAVGETVMKGVQWLASTFAPAAKAVGDAIGAFWTRFKPFAQAIGAIVGAGLWTTFTALAKAIEAAAWAAEKLAPVLAGLAAFKFISVVSGLSAVANGINIVKGSATGLTAAFANFMLVGRYAAAQSGITNLTGAVGTLKSAFYGGKAIVSSFFGQIVSGAVVAQAAIAAIAAGVMYAMSEMNKMRDTGRKRAEDLVKGFDTRYMGSKNQGIVGAMNAITKKLRDNAEEQRQLLANTPLIGGLPGGTGTIGILSQSAWEALPGTDNVLSQLKADARELGVEYDKLRKKFDRYVNNNKRVANTLDGKFTFEQIGQAAARVGADLTKTGEAAIAERNKVIDSLLLEQKYRQQNHDKVQAFNEMDAEAQQETLSAWEKQNEEIMKTYQAFTDLGKALEIAKERAKLFNAALKSPSEVYSDYSSKITEEARKASQDSADAFNKGLEDRKDALERTAQAVEESYQDRIDRAKNPRVKERLRDELDAYKQGIDDQKKALDDSKKTAEDFFSEPTGSLSGLLASLTEAADKSEEFNNLLRQASAKGASDEVISMFRSMGEDGLPLLKQFVDGAADYVTQFNEEIARLNTDPGPTLEDLSMALDKQSQQARDFVLASATILSQIQADPNLQQRLGFNESFTPEDFVRQLQAMGPEFAPIIQQVAWALATGSEEGVMQAQAIIRKVSWNNAFADLKDGAITALGVVAQYSKDTAAMTAEDIKTHFGQIQKSLVEMMANLQTLLNVPDINGTDWRKVYDTLYGGQSGGGGGGPAGKRTGIPNPMGGRTVPNVSNPSGRPIPAPTAPHEYKVQNNRSGMHGRTYPLSGHYPQDLVRTALSVDATLPRGTYWVWQTSDGKFVQRRAWYWANGGINSKENHSAQIAKPGDMRVWAEPETGGEAYIPLAAAKRDRSTKILKEVASRFGYSVIKFANGGINQNKTTNYYAKGSVVENNNEYKMLRRPSKGSDMVNSGRFGNTQPQIVYVTQQSGPIEHKNIWEFNGDIRGVDMNDAIAYAERKKRSHSLTRR